MCIESFLYRERGERERERENHPDNKNKCNDLIDPDGNSNDGIASNG